MPLSDSAFGCQNFKACQISAVSYQLSVLCFEDQVWADCQPVHASTFEAVYRLFRSTNDWFILIETRIQNHGNPGPAFKGPNQVVVERILLPVHGLKPPGIVDMIDRAKLGALFWTNPVNMQHERRGMVVLEIFI